MAVSFSGPLSSGGILGLDDDGASMASITCENELPLVFEKGDTEELNWITKWRIHSLESMEACRSVRRARWNLRMGQTLLLVMENLK